MDWMMSCSGKRNFNVRPESAQARARSYLVLNKNESSKAPSHELSGLIPSIVIVIRRGSMIRISYDIPAMFRRSDGLSILEPSLSAVIRLDETKMISYTKSLYEVSTRLLRKWYDHIAAFGTRCWNNIATCILCCWLWGISKILMSQDIYGPMNRTEKERKTLDCYKRKQRWDVHKVRKRRQKWKGN